KSIILRNKKYLWISCLSLIVIFIAYLMTDYNFEWLFGSKPYSEIDRDVTVYSALKRLFIYIVIFVSTLSFMNLIPERKLSLTYIGSRTMFIYFVHMLVAGLLRGQACDNDLVERPYASIGIIAITIIIVYFYSTDLVKHYENPVVNMKKPPTKNKYNIN